MSNNSVIIERGSITEEEFLELWKKIELSGSGEPGFYWTNDLELGTNPCCEIGLNANQHCNLNEVNAGDITSQEDLNQRVRAAAFFGTLQAGFTDFHYLRPIWKKTSEEEALLGVSMTGIASGEVLSYNLTEAAEIVLQENARVAALTGINPTARATCIKPAGTTSCILGVSSGIHGWHDKYYLRTIRFNTNEAIAEHIIQNHPNLYEKDLLRPHDTICVRIPIKAPDNAIFRTETAIELLERVKKFSQEWIKPGHVSGANTHNVSATISIDKERMYGDKNEWQAVGEWMWENKEYYNGLSVLPYDGGSYVQAPFESITEEEYTKRITSLTDLDVTLIKEFDDNVQFGDIAACAGGACETN